MKALKFIIYAVFALFLIQVAAAANTGYVVSYPNGTTVSGCTYVADGASAYTVISSAYGLDDAWSNNVLNSLGGSTSDATNKWYLWSNDGGSAFLTKDLDYTSTKVGRGYVIGIAYSTSNSTGAPSFILYDTLCPNKLSINDFRVEIDGSTSKDFNEDDIDNWGGKGTIDEVPPNATIVITIELENLWEEDEEVEGEDEIAIEDITIEAEIKDIDDGDDLEAEEEADPDEMDAEEEQEVTMEFKIPLAVEDEKYLLPITIRSQDTLGRHYDYDINISLSVEKESHKMIFEGTRITSNNLTCSRSSSVAYKIINIGKKDEDVVLTLTNAPLEISKTEEFEVEKYAGDADDAEKSGSMTFSISETAPAGSYMVSLRATYDDGVEVLTKEMPLDIKDCVRETTETTTETTTTQGTTNPTVQVIKPTPQTQLDVAEEEKSFLEENGTMIGIVIAEVVVVGGVIGLIFALRKKKY